MCCAALALCLAASNASAQLIFQREKLIVAPPPVTQVQEDTPATKPTAKKKPSRKPRLFMVEVRSEEALNLEYIHTLNGLKKGDGVMIVFNAPSMVTVPRMNVYEPVDILFITDDGEVLQILPSIVPAEINRDIEAKDPVRAFLYIKSGEAKRLHIRPRDVVSHGVFNAKPIILQ